MEPEKSQKPDLKSTGFVWPEKKAKRINKKVRQLICEILNLAALALVDGDEGPAASLAEKGKERRKLKSDPGPLVKKKSVSLRIREETSDALSSFSKNKDGVSLSDILRGAAVTALDEI